MTDFLSPNQVNQAIREQRSSIRMDISMLVRVAKLSPRQYDLYQGAFDELRRKFSLSMMYAQEMRHGQMLIRKLKVRNPDMAQFAESIEKRLTIMNELSDGHLQFLSDRFRQTVNISIDGARVLSKDNLEPGDKVCVRMVHPESSTFFIALAEVVYTQAPADDVGDFKSSGAIKFILSNAKDRISLDDLIKQSFAEKNP